MCCETNLDRMKLHSWPNLKTFASPNDSSVAPILLSQMLPAYEPFTAIILAPSFGTNLILSQAPGLIDIDQVAKYKNCQKGQGFHIF